MGKKKGQSKLDLSYLSEEEIESIVSVIQKDFELQALEQKRLQKRKREVDEAKRKLRHLASARQNVDDRLCVICMDKFMILFNPRLECQGCQFGVCKKCATFVTKYQNYFCKMCLQRSDLISMSCDWFYESVKKRFKEFGSVKIARYLFKEKSSEDTIAVRRQSAQLNAKPNRTFGEDMLSPEVLRRVQEAQVSKFRQSVQELTDKTNNKLISSQHECEREYIVNEFKKEVRSLLINFGQILYVTMETHNSILDDEQLDVHAEVAKTIQEEVEKIAEHPVNASFDDSKSLASFEESCLNGGRTDFEETLAQAIASKVARDHHKFRIKQGLNSSETEEADIILNDLNMSLMGHQQMTSLERTFLQSASLRRPRLPLPRDRLQFLDLSSEGSIETRRQEMDPDVLSLAAVAEERSFNDAQNWDSVSCRGSESEEDPGRTTPTPGHQDSSSDSSVQGDEGWVRLSRNPIGSFRSLNKPNIIPKAGTRDDPDHDMSDQDILSDEERSESLVFGISQKNSYHANPHLHRDVEDHKTLRKSLSQDSGIVPSERRASDSPDGVVSSYRHYKTLSNGPLKDPRFELSPPQDLEVADGDIVKVRVEVEGSSPIDIQWYRVTNSGAVRMMPSDRVELLQGRIPGEYQLVMWDTGSHQTGEYLVVATNSSGVEKRTFFINVIPNKTSFKRPEFITLFTDEEALLGGHALFQCQVAGYPAPRVYFFKGGRPLHSINEKVDIFKTGPRAYACKIMHVTEEDEAEYSCRASNRLGHCHCEAELTIRDISDDETTEERILHSSLSSPSKPQFSNHKSAEKRPNKSLAMELQEASKQIHKNTKQNRRIPHISDVGDHDEEIARALRIEKEHLERVALSESSLRRLKPKSSITHQTVGATHPANVQLYKSPKPDSPYPDEEVVRKVSPTPAKVSANTQMPILRSNLNIKTPDTHHYQRTGDVTPQRRRDDITGGQYQVQYPHTPEKRQRKDLKPS